MSEVAVFTYGTLQLPSVQLDTFGRVIEAHDDVLPGFTADYRGLHDARLSHTSGRAVHPVVRATGNPLDKIVGKVLLLTDAELDAADEYEAAGYRRRQVTLSSGTRAWVFVAG